MAQYTSRQLRFPVTVFRVGLRQRRGSKGTDRETSKPLRLNHCLVWLSDFAGLRRLRWISKRESSAIDSGRRKAVYMHEVSRIVAAV